MFESDSPLLLALNVGENIDIGKTEEHGIIPCDRFLAQFVWEIWHMEIDEYITLYLHAVKFSKLKTF